MAVSVSYVRPRHDKMMIKTEDNEKETIKYNAHRGTLFGSRSFYRLM